MDYIELCSGICDDCTIAIANNDYSGMSDEQEKATRDGIKRIGQHLIVGDDLGFCSHNRCAVCELCCVGNRHEVGYLTEEK